MLFEAWEEGIRGLECLYLKPVSHLLWWPAVALPEQDCQRRTGSCTGEEAKQTGFERLTLGFEVEAPDWPSSPLPADTSLCNNQ